MTTLTAEEQAELTRHEQTLSPEAKFWERGKAFAAIQDRKLYRSVGTFEDYCGQRWGFSKSRVYQYIRAAEVMDDLTELAEEERPFSSTIVDAATGSIEADLPQNEGQARELIPIPRDQRREVWDRIWERAHREGRGITAEFVAAAVALWLSAEGRLSRPRRGQRPLRRRKPPSLEIAEERVLNAAYAYGTASTDGDRVERAAALKVLKKAGETLFQAEQAEAEEDWETGFDEEEWAHEPIRSPPAY